MAGTRRRSPGRSQGGGAPGPGAWLKLVLALLVVGVLAFLVVRWVQSPVERPDLGRESSAPAPVAQEPVPTEAQEPVVVDAEDPSGPPIEPESVAPADPSGHLAIVIDDLGRSLDKVERLEALGVPLSYAVLPYESKTAAVVSHLRGADREILCHLPMEAVRGNNPGPGALVLGMSPRELARATRDAVARVPGAVGVNNHMGSGLTSDEASMGAILRVLRDEELFFLDSRTSAETVAFDVARSLEIPTAERQVFLDTDPAEEAIRAQFERLRQIAAERGAAIAIGHPYESTLSVLGEEIESSRSQGFVFVPVSFLLERTGLR